MLNISLVWIETAFFREVLDQAVFCVFEYPVRTSPRWDVQMNGEYACSRAAPLSTWDVTLLKTVSSDVRMMLATVDYKRSWSSRLGVPFELVKKFCLDVSSEMDREEYFMSFTTEIRCICSFGVFFSHQQTKNRCLFEFLLHYVWGRKAWTLAQQVQKCLRLLRDFLSQRPRAFSMLIHVIKKYWHY